MRSRLGTLLSGLTWTYGSQLSSIVIQFGYAAVTSRLVSSGGFGTYAVALTVSGFVSLIANGGLGQSVSRMITLDRYVLGGLATYSLGLGVLGATLLFGSAGFWSNLWGDSNAKVVIQLLCISLLFSPQIGLNMGLMRREGRFRQLAINSFVSNIIGMFIGLLLVIKFGNAESLVASPIIMQISIFLLCTIHNRGLFLRFKSMRAAKSDVGFSTNVIVSSVLSYFASNLGKWSVSRWAGASALGQWNRADVVTTVPFFQIQTAIVQVVYPEFRHDRQQSERSRRVWPDLLTLTAWACVPPACFAAWLLPKIVPILFGEGWEMAAGLSAPLLIIAAVQVVTTVLGGAVEALGKFRWIWCCQLIMISIQICGVVATISTRNLTPAIVTLGVVVVARQLVYVTLCHRAGHFNAYILLGNYSWVALGSVLAGCAGLVVSVSLSLPVLWLATVPALSVLFFSMYWWRRFLPPIVIFNRYRAMVVSSQSS